MSLYLCLSLSLSVLLTCICSSSIPPGQHQDTYSYLRLCNRAQAVSLRMPTKQKKTVLLLHPIATMLRPMRSGGLFGRSFLGHLLRGRNDGKSIILIPLLPRDGLVLSSFTVNLNRTLKQTFDSNLNKCSHGADVHSNTIFGDRNWYQVIG